MRLELGGAGTLLTILFIALKLTGHITWAWLWVLAPTWIPLGLALGLMLMMLPFILVKKVKGL